ncbi:MAG: hypothetical protein QW175_01525 [Candidatus Bathyarchaeia archaeon]
MTDYCPHRGAPIKITDKRAGFLIAGGILAFIASYQCLDLGLSCILLAVFPSGFYNHPQVAMWIVGISGIIGSTFGLSGGMSALRKSKFALTIVSLSVLLISSLTLTVVRAISALGGTLVAHTVAETSPIIILSVLSIIFTAISRNEFT